MDSKIVGISSKIQHSLSSVIQDMPVLSRPSNFFDSLQSRPEIITKRIKSGRNPSTGLIQKVQSVSPIRPSTAATGLNMRLNMNSIRNFNTTKLDTRVIESWINATLSDSEYLDIPGCIAKPEKKLPLFRFGIDRQSLKNSGIPSEEIDSIYQSLFVHSIAFYQTLSKVLEHSEKKYTIVTALWKVFAILLEYCCKLDYQMIITTLNIEKRDELEQLELSYKNQMAFYEENQRNLENALKESKEQIRRLQRQFELEIQKKEELEDELMQKGSGHEEEVSARIRFESKVNQMYAKQRDMETKLQIIKENNEELQKNLDLKTNLFNKEKKNAEDMAVAKERIENEYRRTEEKLKQSETVNNALEQRLNEAYTKIDELTMALSKSVAQFSECQNDLTQKKLEIEEKKFEIEIRMNMISKLEKNIEELRSERNILVKRTSELENLFNEECEKNQHYKQEYARIKESDNFYAIEYMKFKDKAESLEKKCEELSEEKNKYRIQLESMIQGYEEYKVQVKKGQERIEEMNKGRRVVEEQNEFLNSRLSEKNEEIKDLRNMNLDLKDDLEKLKTRENTLENEITTLTIKLKSLEKQYEANKETMQQKINSLSEIISSEKRIRESWIVKYEEEQKNLSQSNRLLVVTQDQQSELKNKLNSTVMQLEEKNQKLSLQITKNSEQLEEILELKAYQEELQRKNKTLQMLYENSEKERLDLIKAHQREIEELTQVFGESKENLMMRIEFLWEISALNLESFKKKSKDFDDLLEKFQKLTDLQQKTFEKLEERIKMWDQSSLYAEDLLIWLKSTHSSLVDLEEKYEILTENFNELEKNHTDFMNLIPEHLRDQENPFEILSSQVAELSGKLEEINFFKANMIDFEVQHENVVITFDENTQTDIGFSFFERTRKTSNSGTPHSGSQRNYSAKSKDAPATISEFPLKKRESIHHDSVLREETPINMASIYNPSLRNLKGLPAIKSNVSGFQNIQPAPPDIKRLIKTANSRRKNDTNFL